MSKMVTFRWTLLIVVFIYMSHVGCQAQKPDKKREGRNPGKMSSFQFRSVRVNQVWEKAQRMGKKGKELEMLKADLLKHDERVSHLKKIERDGGDTTGEQSEKLHKKLTEIMKKHNIIPGENPNKPYVPTKDRPFTDKRLNDLWRKTLDAEHFDEKEVNIMKQQLKIHQEKVDQYQALVDGLYGKKDDGPNSVHGSKKDNLSDDEKKLFKAKELDLKLHHKKLNKDFQLLAVKTMPEEERGGFKEPRIINFWKEAKQSNFTEEELSSLKEELLHFEAKLFKYDKIQEEAMKAEHDYQKKKLSGVKADPKKHNTLKEKAKEFGTTIKKYFNEVKDKISSRKLNHSEL
ncbi:alpha-2-macroglobulin receptor-associated protein-like [Anneissia japonica]|uniref:alpha-2-macroglobulin receptor-associated protein-like n=1 Tax=Anneissia japonica TaxID=1529436 RepID=UPI001425745E|nr:alpha-2-macroglobulin receptor-associated protein-like [Anneissia japonica]